MHRYRTYILLRDTDATGVIYFPNQLHLALEAFEDFLRPKSFSFQKIFDSEFLMPVVHAESDYMAPLEVDDEVEVVIYLEKVGYSSFSLCFDYLNVTKNMLAGTAKITHVVTSKLSKKSTAIPEELRTLLLLLTPKKECPIH